MQAIFAAMAFSVLVSNLSSVNQDPVQYQNNLYTRINASISSLSDSNTPDKTSDEDELAMVNELKDIENILGIETESKQKVSPTSTPSPIPTKQISPTPTKTPTTSPSSTPTAIPTPTTQPVTINNTGVDVVGMVERYATEYAVDVNLMKKIASCESSFNPNAGTNLYAGLFQFSEGTWVSTRNRMGLDPNPDLRFSAEEAAKTAAFKIKHDGPGAWSGCL